MIETQKQLAALLKERNDQNDAVVGAQPKPKPKAPQTPRGVKTPRSVSTDSKFTLSFEKVSQRSLDVFGFSLSDFGATSPEPTNSTNPLWGVARVSARVGLGGASGPWWPLNGLNP